MTGDPPDRWMVEEDGFDDALQYIQEIVMAADVCQFVNQKRFYLCG